MKKILNELEPFFWGFVSVALAIMLIGLVVLVVEVLRLFAGQYHPGPILLAVLVYVALSVIVGSLLRNS